MRAAWGALVVALLSGSVLAQDDVEGALKLADQAPDTKAEATDFRAFVEGGVTDSLQNSGTSQLGERLSLDVHDDSALAPGWRFIFADRLDLEQLDHPDSRNNFNTLKEAYLSWQLQPDLILDAGRVNLRYGVATGYNPTDFFRPFAIRSIVSLDPSSLRENRQGTVLVEGQWLTEQGSVSAIFSPKLADNPSEAEFSPDLGATNGDNRWLLSATQKVTEAFAPQAILFGGAHQSTQAGVNLSTLVNSATTAYLEWSGGEAPTLASQAFSQNGPESFRRRASLGATYTTDFNLTLTLEYESNSAGLDQAGLNRIVNASPFALLGYLAYIAEVQDLPTQRSWFALGTLTDAVIQHLDITTFARYDPVSHSRLEWAETRYHFDHADLALQLEYTSGTARSIYGAIPTQRMVEVLLRYFL